MFDTPYTTRSFPRMRNSVLDIVHDGKKRDTIYFTFEVDVTDVLHAMKSLKAKGILAPSITSYMIRCFAKTIGESEYKTFNGYRQGKNRLVLFEDVDVAIPVEKDVDGYVQPVYHIVRAANTKDLAAIQADIDHLKGASWEEIMPSIEKYFFGKWPDFLRRIFWAIARARPKVRKFFSGTVGLTSVGMFGSGKVHLFPLTPLTSTLSVGGIVPMAVLVDNNVTTREMLCLTLCVDHEIIDGAPAMRFITRFKAIVESCFELPSALCVEETTINTVPSSGRVASSLS